MKNFQAAGWLLISGSIGVLIPYSILSIIFDYPAILREDPGIILTRFHAGGITLIMTWLAFALLGLPLLIAYSIIGQHLEKGLKFVRWVTAIGIISGIAQIVGLLRWVFVVPLLAKEFINTNDPAIQETIKIIFRVLHQFAGVLMGEHIGQLFTIIWTVMTSIALVKQNFIPKWMGLFGILVSAIYLLAQAELLATVIERFPVWPLAGLLGSSLWLIWLIMVGVRFVKMPERQ
jgi:Domain of unknown function (DUF4386)